MAQSSIEKVRYYLSSADLEYANKIGLRADLACLLPDEIAPPSAFPVATRLELVDRCICGVNERTTIKCINSLHF
jgi:hypothetical protein